MKLRFISCIFLFFLFSCKDQKKIEDHPNSTVITSPLSPPTVKDKPAPVEWADSQYTVWGRERMRLFEAAEYDKWAEGFSEKAVMQWSGGDSLVGKEAITAYWKEQHLTTIDTIQIANDSWLAVRVNQPLQATELPGVWLLSWAREDVKYRNKKSLRFWVHQKAHYNTASKIDRIIIYMDKAPVNKVLETGQTKTVSARRRL
jgi:hypothetical protein